MTTSTAPATHAHGLVALNWVRTMFNQMLDTLEPSQCLHQPGGSTNHAHWLAGHLAVSDEYFLAEFGGHAKSCPESWSKLFGHGSEPCASGTDYPPLDEVRRVMNRIHEDLVSFFEAADEATLNQPLPDDWQTFAPILADLPAGMAAHEGMHVGQLANVRKSLGMKPVMGT